MGFDYFKANAGRVSASLKPGDERVERRELFVGC